ncbi:MAG: leucine--tRNA ligase [Rhizobacter sp.]|nr:leucine--tRNA ligase [Ferruginibacter sp.]
MEYDFRKIESEWQKKWKESKAYKVSNDSPRPKCYVLDMFPYPSGAGLHVGHPLGYIASDIYSRYKRLKGFNVLHPMGFDSFGLPAEQYAIETGQHPADTTEKNIATFKSQLDKIGFCYDWDREVCTSDESYYKWTQWIFLQLFNSYFCNTQQKARPIADLIKKYEGQGSKHFTAAEWNSFNEKEKTEWLMKRRLAFIAWGEVNWCEALGTVLANDEVVNGVSERGGHPVVKKKMRQWYLRITAYADRLLQSLETVNFSDAMKEMQKNWIGKSEGAEVDFEIQVGDSSDKRVVTQLTGDIELVDVTIMDTHLDIPLKVYTTRPDTIFGVDFMVVAPEHELVSQITTPDQKSAIDEYLTYVKSRSDRERMSEVKQVTGCFTGAYAINPFNKKQIPIYIAEYVLAGYGTGAIMAVPCGDQRDFDFAKHFNIPVTNIIGSYYDGSAANPTKEAILENSDFLNGVLMKDAIGIALDKIEALGIGKRKVNFRMRDAGFSRQRYWGEPFPIKWIDGVPVAMSENELPVKLPHVEKYGPGPEGEGPLANIPEWAAAQMETSTMPGYAGSSWYFLRYMDPHNNSTFCDRKVSDYWNQVDVYIGGTEHAVGHLLYSRMWTKVLFDLGLIGFDEPFKKLVNQGMIGAHINYINRLDYNYKIGDGASGIVNVEKFIENYGIHPDQYKPELPQIFISKELSDKIVDENLSKADEQKLTDAIKIATTDYMKGVAGKIEFDEGWKPLVLESFVVNDSVLDIDTFKQKSRLANSKSIFVYDDKFYCHSELGKMGKRYHNAVNPDELCEKYGADTFRMYEMFLGPVEQSKPWDTKGIEGVHRFLKKLWRLFNDELKGKIWKDDKATDAEMKILQQAIKKIEHNTETFSFNTAVSSFMVCVNELSDAKCHKKEVLEKVLILLTPYAPHIAAELWSQLGNEGSVLDASYPMLEEKYLVETSKEYPVSINGKLRTTIALSLDLDPKQVEELVLQNDIVQKWLEGNAPKKIIFVKGKMVNVVI